MTLSEKVVPMSLTADFIEYLHSLFMWFQSYCMFTIMLTCQCLEMRLTLWLNLWVLST